MVEENSMHGLADIVVATQGETQVADASADVGSGKVALNPSSRLDEVHGIVVVLFHARSDGQHIGVEDDVQRIHPYLFGQYLVGTLGNFDAALITGGLPFLIEAHHHHGSTIALHILGVTDEHFLAFLQRDAVHDALALDAFQSGHDNLPFRRVEHHGHTGYLRLGSYHVKEVHHLRLGVQKAVIHIDVDDKGAVFHLLAGNGHGFLVLLFLNQAKELSRTCHIATLTHVYEMNLGSHIEGLQSAQLHRHRLSHRLMDSRPTCHFHISADKLGSRSAASAEDVHQAFVDKLLNLRRHAIHRLVVLSELVGQSGIRIGADIIWCMLGQFLQERLHLGGTE